MPPSEIDDIFAAKPKGKARAAPTAPPAPAPTSSKHKHKRKRGAAKDTPVDGEKPAKRRVPETVLDPSVHPPAPAKPPKAARQPEPKHRHKKPNKEDEQRFKDSRGTGPRRKTEEGFSIYKEDELGITDAGGDTPLCPFDCQCCF